MHKLASTGIHLTLIGVTWYPVDSILNQLVSVNRFTINRSVYWVILINCILLYKMISVNGLDVLRMLSGIASGIVFVNAMYLNLFASF